MKCPKTLTVVITIGVIIVLGIVFGLLFVKSGIYNVAAIKPHTPLVLWVLSTARDASVGRHARSVKVPADFAKMDQTEGLEHYHEMCVTCHGAPGVDRGEIGQGLNPEPPLLYKSVTDLSPAEVYWIVYNGIKMTGMPAFHPTHTDQQVWAITAFVKKLPKMSAADYKAQVEKMEKADAGKAQN